MKPERGEYKCFKVIQVYSGGAGGVRLWLSGVVAGDKGCNEVDNYSVGRL